MSRRPTTPAGEGNPNLSDASLLAQIEAARQAARVKEEQDNLCPFTRWVCQDQISGGVPRHDTVDGLGHEIKPLEERIYEWIGPNGGTPTCPVCGSDRAMAVISIEKSAT